MKFLPTASFLSLLSLHSHFLLSFLSCIDGSPKAQYYFGLSGSLAFCICSVIHLNSSYCFLAISYFSYFFQYHLLFGEVGNPHINTLSGELAKYYCSPWHDCSTGMWNLSQWFGLKTFLWPQRPSETWEASSPKPSYSILK